MKSNTQNIDMQTVAARLRSVRDEKGLTRKEVSTKTGIPYTALEKYETGNQDPKIGRLNLLADVYEVPVQELLGIEVALQNLEASPNRPHSENKTSDKKDEQSNTPELEKSQTGSITLPLKKEASTLRNIGETVNVTENEALQKNEVPTYRNVTKEETAQDLLRQLDDMRKTGFKTGQRVVFTLVDRIHNKLAELEPAQLEALALERKLFCDQPEEGFNFCGLFNDDPIKANELFKGNIGERILDTAFFGIDLYAIDRDDLVNVADELQEEGHEIIEPAYFGLSWGEYEQFVPLIRPILRNMVLLGKGYELTNNEIFSPREHEEF